MNRILKDLENLKTIVSNLKREKKKIVFTNGCFDILHAGHVDYLEKAKSLGDVLIVGMNSDSSIKRIKGEKRPIVSQDYRAKVLIALKAVDYVFIFEDDTPYKVIEIIKPHVLVKGTDWPIEKIVGKEFAERVERIPFEYDISTSKIIERVVKLYCSNKS
ncbi:rfaE bifunctional protein [Desulfurobacterium thermolithotrophum DSM 11699]|uniref:D-glycero-beta-D-manno-heptose 1-phosphate adenylyltransferase n=1 Tax=Desulfurobacterium thermolithotrophum (strain DSM 11699 / BSA) TaxID=868864 RepID=F0S0X4_DESTD|nr:D-glycero-beta-D-manno-heptose 1-phosphate adenylyltransferase [Desulfurobacterium thermolithotrophum]ADY72778.1 rfaE bifunctional protein [Desulfurobacterium thermolithotrophum DSM 11699]